MSGTPTGTLQTSASFAIANAFEAGALTTLQFGRSKAAPTYLSTFDVTHYFDGDGSSTVVRLL